MVNLISPKTSIITFVIGSILLLTGGIVYVFIPSIITSELAQKLPLSPESMLLSNWKDIPIAIYRQFYMFNYTNAPQLNVQWNSSVKPRVQQLGPYTYRDIRHKVFLNWDDDEDKVSYYEIHNFHFVPELSKGSEDDLIYVPNLPLAVIVSMADDSLKDILNELIKASNLSYFAPLLKVGDLLYRGYHDDLIDMAQALKHYELLPGAMFAFFYGKNGSDDGLYQIRRGKWNLGDAFQISMWNGSERLPEFGGDCGRINGSDGTFFSPRTNKEDRVYVFVSDVCRSFFLEYYGETEFRGIKGYRYTSTLDLFADPNMNPDNGCFCYPKPENCIASGISSVSLCKFGAPMFISHPHFLMTDFRIRDAIDGLEPNADEHKAVVDLEPISGIPLSINARFQLSIRQQPVKGIDLYENAPDILLPIVWVNETGCLDDTLLDLLNNKMFTPMALVHAAPIVTMGVGGLLTALSITCSMFLMRPFQ